MIRNLNQINFHNFGTVLPERGQPDQHSRNIQTVSLCESTPRTYQAESPTWLCNISGMCILSVSNDNGSFLDFYLDKPTWINAGVYFSLSSFRGNASVHIAADTEPQLLESPPQNRQLSGAVWSAGGEPVHLFLSRKGAGFSVCR